MIAHQYSREASISRTSAQEGVMFSTMKELIQKKRTQSSYPSKIVEAKGSFYVHFAETLQMKSIIIDCIF